MNKDELINYCLDNNYKYSENKTEIDIDILTDDLGNYDETISFNKEDKTIQIWLSENGSGFDHILTSFEIEIVSYFKEIYLNKE